MLNSPPPPAHEVIANLRAENERLQRIVDFVALWCYRKTVAGDHERLSVITYHPGIKAAAEAARLAGAYEQSQKVELNHEPLSDEQLNRIAKMAKEHGWKTK